MRRHVVIVVVAAVVVVEVVEVVVEGQVAEDADPAAHLDVFRHDGVVHRPAHAVQEDINAG
jgi:hypothetical protein